MSGVRARCAAAVLIAMVATAGGATAQTRLPDGRDQPKFPTNQSPKEREEGRRLTNEYAECVVRARHALARRFVVEFRPISETFQKNRVHRLLVPDCAAIGIGGYSFQFRGESYRHEMALALFDRDLAGQPPLADLASVPALDQTTLIASLAQIEAAREKAAAAGPTRRRDVEALERIAGSAKIARVELLLAIMAECVIRVSPADAAAFLRTGVASAEERAAGRALAVPLGRCVSKDTTFTLRIGQLRGPLAVTYYRLAAARGVLAPIGETQ